MQIKAFLEAAFGIVCTLGGGSGELDITKFTDMRKRRLVKFNVYPFIDDVADALEPAIN